MTEDKMAGWHQRSTNSMDMSLSKLRVKDKDAWRAAVHGVAESAQLSDWTTTTTKVIYIHPSIFGLPWWC